MTPPLKEGRGHLGLSGDRGQFSTIYDSLPPSLRLPSVSACLATVFCRDFMWIFFFFFSSCDFILPRLFDKGVWTVFCAVYCRDLCLSHFVTQDIGLPTSFPVYSPIILKVDNYVCVQSKTLGSTSTYFAMLWLGKEQRIRIFFIFFFVFFLEFNWKVILVWYG